jgi:hypothetical protein
MIFNHKLIKLINKCNKIIIKIKMITYQLSMQLVNQINNFLKQ